MNSYCKTMLAVVAFALIQSAPAQDQAEPAQTDALPPKILIAGVPFVGWSEAAQVDYPHKDILNPSDTAVLMMQQKFWGRDPTRFNLFGPRLFVRADWQAGDGSTGRALEDLKRPLAHGIPVYVHLTLTPYAQPEPVSTRIASILGFGGKSSDAQGAGAGPSSSGALGRMVAPETLRSLGASEGTYKNQRGETHSAEYLYLRESLYSSPRLLIGYDDERRVMIVHDPSFGPALEIGYDDFDTMWRYKGRAYVAAVPEGVASIAAKRPSAPPYPLRTPDMQAALHFVTGYAQAQIGRSAEAEQAFAKGLALPGVGPGYRFMLAFEVAHIQVAAHHPEDAVAALRLATDMLPQACPAWQMLAKLYRENPALPDANGLAVETDARVKRICSDSNPMAIWVKAIPRDFYVEGMAQLRGWGYDKLGR